MIHAEQYDPRTKLFMVMMISSLGVFFNKPLVMSVLLIMTFFLSYGMGAEPWRVLHKMKRIMGVFIMISLLQSIFAPSGKVLISLGNLVIVSAGGLEKGIVFMLRVSIIIISASLMTTSSPRKIVQGLVQLKIPYELAFMVSVAIRFLPLLGEEIKDVITAIQLRGVILNQVPLKKRIKTYSYLLTPMIASVLMKSRELSIAMELRAFRAYPNRTSYCTLTLTSKDYIAMGVTFIVTLVFILII